MTTKHAGAAGQPGAGDDRPGVVPSGRDRRGADRPRTVPTPVAPIRPAEDAGPIEGQVLGRPYDGPGGQRPDSVIQLIYLMWLSLDWRRAGTVAFLMCAIGLALCAVLGGLGYLLMGLSPLLSAGGGFLVGGGVAAAGYRYLRRNRRSAAPPA